MEIKERKINELIPAEYNPRQLSKEQAEQLKASLQRFGAVDPAIVNMHPDRKNIIVGGHQRLKTAQSIGWDTFPCVEVELDRDKERELNIRLNKNTGSWDYDALADYFEVEELTEWGFTDSELFGDVEIKEAEAKEDDYKEPDEIHTDIVLGDLIQIGQHRLLCGDSTSTDEWAKIMNDELCDLVITDPPYNVDYVGGTGLKIMNDKMDNDSFYQFLYDFYTALNSYTKKGGSWYVWHADSEGANFRRAMADAGISVRQCLIWVKNSMVMGRQDYHWKHEPCLYGWKEGAGHYFTDDRTKTTVFEDKIDIKKLSKAQMAEMLTTILSDKIPTSILRADKPHKSELHPTMKPVLLIAELIKNSSKNNDLICDAFLGSGTTMVASHQLGRKCYGMELDPKYCQVIIDRMLKLDETLEVKINGEPYGI